MILTMCLCIYGDAFIEISLLRFFFQVKLSEEMSTLIHNNKFACVRSILARKWNRKIFDYYLKLENLRDAFDLCSSPVNI